MLKKLISPPLLIALPSAVLFWATVLADHHGDQSDTGSTRGVEELLKRFDLDGNRMLSPSEIKSLLPYLPPVVYDVRQPLEPTPTRLTGRTIVMAMDTDGDGLISRSEASEDLKMHFDALDSNADGKINIDEAEVAAQYANAHQTQSDEEPAMKSGVPETKIPSQGKYTGKDMITFLDRNGDGAITIEEATAELKPNFGLIDVNGDGRIDEQEAEVMAQYANQTQNAN